MQLCAVKSQLSSAKSDIDGGIDWLRRRGYAIRLPGGCSVDGDADGDAIMSCQAPIIDCEIG